ncbi:MAG: hypothetical protein ED557_00095 [Balneola sp.]|nr:MAG: hypothetical protein ED557_00095 [Balneola sp.]
MKFVWTFNGIGLAVLIVISIIDILPFHRVGYWFESDTSEKGLIVAKKAERAEQLNIDLQHLIYDQPTSIKNSEFYYSPVIVQDKDLPRDVVDMINSASDISIYMVGAAINVIFFNKDRTEVRRLLPNNGYIHSFTIGSREGRYYSQDEEHLPFAIYKIALADNNGDSRINDKDFTPYYISDLDGTNLRQITPDSLDLRQIWFSDDYNEIYFDRVLEDRDSPLAYRNHFEKTRIIYYYNINRDEFKMFDELQNEFLDIQNSFKN